MTKINGYFSEIINDIRRIDPITGFQESILLGFSEVSAQSEHIARYQFCTNHVRGLTLDAAAGTGYGSSILARNNSNHVMSVDLNSIALAYGKKVYGRNNMCWIQCEVTFLPFRDKVFESIVSIESLEHVCKPTKLLHEFHRIMKSTGRLILSTPNKNVTSPILPGSLNPHHYKEYTVKSLLKLLRSQDIEVMEFFVQTQVSIKSIVARYIGVFPVLLFTRMSMSILPLRRFLNNFRLSRELCDPDPSIYPVVVYSKLIDSLTYFQLIVLARKTKR